MAIRINQSSLCAVENFDNQLLAAHVLLCYCTKRAAWVSSLSAHSGRRWDIVTDIITSGMIYRLKAIVISCTQRASDYHVAYNPTLQNMSLNLCIGVILHGSVAMRHNVIMSITNVQLWQQNHVLRRNVMQISTRPSILLQTILDWGITKYCDCCICYYELIDGFALQLRSDWEVRDDNYGRLDESALWSMRCQHAGRRAMFLWLASSIQYYFNWKASLQCSSSQTTTTNR